MRAVIFDSNEELSTSQPTMALKVPASYRDILKIMCYTSNIFMCAPLPGILTLALTPVLPFVHPFLNKTEWLPRKNGIVIHGSRKRFGIKHRKSSDF
ncbi:hypothetical protein TNCV_2245331 [Trichonephila clavipes]|nr:hypothetical protein TNCV_2245331 [Trichonephila clavipes]